MASFVEVSDVFVAPQAVSGFNGSIPGWDSLSSAVDGRFCHNFSLDSADVAL